MTIFPFKILELGIRRSAKLMSCFLALSFISLATNGSAQTIAGLSTKWDDSFSEWIIYTTYEDVVGEIVLRWPLRNDWSEWDYRIGEWSGSIQIKWKDDPNLWEVRGGNEIITLRTVFQNDFRQWEVKAPGYKMDVKSRWANILEEWYVEGDRHGTFEMFTAWEGDLRDWVVEDKLKPDVSIHTKLALAFIPILYATPKF